MIVTVLEGPKVCRELELGEASDFFEVSRLPQRALDEGPLVAAKRINDRGRACDARPERGGLREELREVRDEPADLVRWVGRSSELVECNRDVR